MYVSVQGLALFTYLFGGVVFSSYVFIFVVCILLLAFDFWTVKVLNDSKYTSLAFYTQGLHSHCFASCFLLIRT